MSGWIMPEPSLDEDDRFHPAMVGGDVLALLFGGKQPDIPVFGMFGPSGMGCNTCGGRPDVAVEFHDVNTTRVLFCGEHLPMGKAELTALITRVVTAPRVDD